MASCLWLGKVPDDELEPPKIGTSVPHVARVYDYWLGSKGDALHTPYRTTVGAGVALRVWRAPCPTCAGGLSGTASRA
jgi:hypothetical protein